MINSGNTIENGKNLESTVCIIGGGAAGITLALELNSMGIDTILIEGGGLTHNDNNQALHEGENISFKNFPISSTRLRVLGGTTNHWGGMAPRLSRSDFEKHQHIPYSGWPISLEDLEPFYIKAEEYCQIPSSFKKDSIELLKNDKQVGFQSGPVNLQLTPWSPPTRFGTEYRNQLEKSKKIRVLIESNVVELETNASFTDVKKVRIRTLRNTEFKVAAKFFISATGGLEVPKLLLASNKQCQAGLGNQNDLVGRFYMDHIGLWSGAAIFANSYSGFDKVSDFLNLNKMRAWYTFVPNEKGLQENKMVNFRYLMSQSPVSYEGVSASASFIEEISRLSVPSKIGMRIADILVDIDQIAAKAIGSNFKEINIQRNSTKTLSGKTFSQAIAGISMEQLPNPDSRVTLSNKKNVLGEQLLKLDWKITQQDKINFLTAAKMLGQTLGANNAGRMYIPKSLRELDFESEIQISCHHMGTARMNNNEKKGVVNSNLRVHGVNNLFISSSAVFPTGGWANPTLTIVALSIKLAKHLKKQLDLL